MQIVDFHQSNSHSAVYPAHDRGVVTCWKVCNDRGFPRVPRRQPAVHDILHLILSDDPADYGSLPVIIRSNQGSVAIVQFQCWVGQWIGNAKLTELRANRTNNHSLWCSALNNEATNHHVVTYLHKAASADVA